MIDEVIDVAMSGRVAADIVHQSIELQDNIFKIGVIVVVVNDGAEAENGMVAVLECAAGRRFLH